jgi:hypothetical protein
MLAGCLAAVGHGHAASMRLSALRCIALCAARMQAALLRCVTCFQQGFGKMPVRRSYYVAINCLTQLIKISKMTDIRIIKQA